MFVDGGHHPCLSGFKHLPDRLRVAIDYTTATTTLSEVEWRLLGRHRANSAQIAAGPAKDRPAHTIPNDRLKNVLAGTKVVIDPANSPGFGADESRYPWPAPTALHAAVVSAAGRLGKANPHRAVEEAKARYFDAEPRIHVHFPGEGLRRRGTGT
ncbi:hypothetical protein [Burkholderia sp. JP2-270]|uniref:hypothetical protein n=1 Tax=Burkholderia sp. JP2-270 TaxID=2217913 RepID=UPI0013A6F9FC|nr:hypothetical protein [Burkholderia sp. JP2-270]